MRTITFAGLIILVGFVAALPYKKAPVPGAAESDSTLATGPLTGLATTNVAPSYDQLVVVSDRQHEGGGYHREPSPLWGQLARSVPLDRVDLVSSAQTPSRIPSDSRARPRRDLRMPLTYDDLAVPLATPHYIDERFEAVAKPEPQQAPRLQVASKFEAMRVQQDAGDALVNQSPYQSPYQSFDDQPTSILNEPDPRAEPVRANKAVPGKLVSDQSRAAEASEPAKPERVRHWIRQPD